MVRRWGALLLLSAAVALGGGLAAQAQVLEWTKQLGTASSDGSFGVSADGLGNVYISGYTLGSLGGANAGSEDAFVSKYDMAGALQWTRQLGTASTDLSSVISADGLGNVYISGNTEGNLGGANAGSFDAFVSKYDADGALQWTRQLGTASEDESYGVSADGLGNVYISGRTRGSLGGVNAGSEDAFVSKYDTAGALQWTRQLGTAGEDGSFGVSADDLGNVYISGYTEGSLGVPHAGSYDAFVSKYDASGDFLWTRQLGTASIDGSRGVSADSLGNVYISGNTQGNLGGANAGLGDAFVSKYDTAGALQWTRQLGTASSDESLSVSADGLGNVYISGYTSGSLGGMFSGGFFDAFVSKYDATGALQWTQQLGTTSSDVSSGISADGLGNVYISGSTEGSLGGANAGVVDAFVAKFGIPEPTTATLLAVVLALLSLKRDSIRGCRR